MHPKRHCKNSVEQESIETWGHATSSRSGCLLIAFSSEKIPEVLEQACAMTTPKWLWEEAEIWPRLKKNRASAWSLLWKFSDGNFIAFLRIRIIILSMCLAFSFFPFTSAAFQLSGGNEARTSYLLLLKFSNPKMSSSPMEWRLSLAFWEVGLKMAELILFTIHRKIRPYIPWEKN